MVDTAPAVPDTSPTPRTRRPRPRRRDHRRRRPAAHRSARRGARPPADEAAGPGAVDPLDLGVLRRRRNDAEPGHRSGHGESDPRARPRGDPTDRSGPPAAPRPHRRCSWPVAGAARPRPADRGWWPQHRRVPRLSGELPDVVAGLARAHVPVTITPARPAQLGAQPRPPAPGALTEWRPTPSPARTPPVGRWQPARAPLPVPLGAGAAIVALALAVGCSARPHGSPRDRGGDSPWRWPVHPPRGVRAAPLARASPGHADARCRAGGGAHRACRALVGLLPAAWLSQWAWWPPLGAVPVLLLLVPDGRLPSPRWWPLAAALVGAAAIATSRSWPPRSASRDPAHRLPHPAPGRLSGCSWTSPARLDR